MGYKVVFATLASQEAPSFVVDMQQWVLGEPPNMVPWCACGAVSLGTNVAAKAYSHDFLAAEFRPTWLFTLFRPFSKSIKFDFIFPFES